MSDRNHLSSMTPSPKQNDDPYTRSCIDRQCTHCGTQLVREHFGPIVDICTDSVFHYYQRENETQHHAGKNQTRKTYNQRSSTMAELVDHLCDLLATYSRHIFNAHWQQRAFSHIKSTLKNNMIVSVIDFAENYSTFFQDAIQSSNWINSQVTLFPMVTWYKCNICPDSPTIHEYLVFISDDMKHDYHVVHMFQIISYGFLYHNREIPVHRIVEFSDGCAAHFKSGGLFADISHSNEEFAVPIERHFFGSRHRKNDSDGVSGVVKSAVRRAVVTSHCIVGSAKDMFEYCKDKPSMPALRHGKCQHAKISFFYVSSSHINRERPERMPKVALKGTKKIHAVRALGPGAVAVRNLSCFCLSCELEQEGPGLRRNRVDGWEDKTLKMPQQVYSHLCYSRYKFLQCQHGCYWYVASSAPSHLQPLCLPIAIGTKSKVWGLLQNPNFEDCIYIIYLPICRRLVKLWYKLHRWVSWLVQERLNFRVH